MQDLAGVAMHVGRCKGTHQLVHVGRSKGGAFAEGHGGEAQAAACRILRKGKAVLLE